MTAAGRTAVAGAKKDGSWAFLDDVEKGIIPDDLAAALASNGQAAAHFEAFPKSAKRGILEWIKQAKRPQTRANRVEETARLAADNKRANQFR
nr:YdeI/OmpD-associated family protein [Aquisalinus flavus]